jgi:primosomal protein N'
MENKSIDNEENNEYAQLNCNRCGYSWTQRSLGKKPNSCPECKSPYFDKPRRVIVTTKQRVSEAVNKVMPETAKFSIETTKEPEQKMFLLGIMGFVVGIVLIFIFLKSNKGGNTIVY